MNVKTLSTLLLCLFVLFSCKEEQNAKKNESAKVEVKTKYVLSPFSQSPSFGDAKLSNMRFSKKTFEFDVSNYELGSQTRDASSKMCANSGKGQHIHLIVDNEPYAAKYVNEFEYELADGGHYLLAFLSRSYHESIKTKDAFICEIVNIEDGEIAKREKIENPMLFYSRPKGTYIGKDTKKVMLDFYLNNTQISEGGNYVEANINGEVHKITEWKPYFIEGLPMGDNYIALTLKDSEGKALEIPLNPVKRIFTLKADPLPEG